MGLDGIGPNVLKHCASALCEPLQHLFNVSLRQHNIPAEWKIHNISPIHKSGDRASVTNYRPISLLSSTSKVLERIIYNKCIQFLETIISTSQFGFLRNRSTLQQLLVFFNNVHETLHQSSQSDAIFLHFAKAFDSVPHKELLIKLRSVGVTGDLWYCSILITTSMVLKYLPH